MGRGPFKSEVPVAFPQFAASAAGERIKEKWSKESVVRSHWSHTQRRVMVRPVTLIPALIMKAADQLCDSLFCWLENREKCAEQLLELAQELEKVNKGKKFLKVAGAATAAITGGAVVAVFTGGLIIPLLTAAVTGTAVGVTSTLVKAGISKRTFNKATELIKEDEKFGTSVQKLLRDLKEKCGGARLGAHADELECEVVTQLMFALARRSKTHVPLDFLRGFNRATFFRHMTPGGLSPDKASRFICQALDLGHVPVIKSSLKVLDEIVSDTSLSCLIVRCEEIVKRKRVRKASKFLRDSSGEILGGQQKLKEQLDAMHKIIQKLLRLKNLVKDLGGYSLSMTANAPSIIAYIMGTCTDNEVLSWLQGLTHQIEFVNVLRFFLENFGPLFEDLTKPGGGHMDIVFVAHGSIVDQFMPAGGLVPTPTIRDTILYSPWNCAIDAKAAFAIAQGFIDMTNREFVNMTSCEPNPLPLHWNNMRGSRHNIPGILLSPVKFEEEVWAYFHGLWMNREMEIEDRIIIPYVVPETMVNAFREIPLFVFIFAASFILMLCGKTATVHLAACLNRREGTRLMPAEWRRQYAYTSDGISMSVNMDDRDMNPVLFRAFRSMFDRNRR